MVACKFLYIFNRLILLLMKPIYNFLLAVALLFSLQSVLAQPFIPIELIKPNSYVTMVTDVAEDTNGDLYIGTDGGLLIKKQSGVNYEMIDSVSDASGNYRPIKILCVEMVRGKVWVGTEASGAYYFKNGNWVNLNTSHGMPSNKVNAISEGGSQFTYLACNGGIARFSGSIVTVLKPFTNNQIIEYVDYHGGFLYASNNSRYEPIKKFSGSLWVDVDSIPPSLISVGRNRARQILFGTGGKMTIKTSGDGQVLHYDGQQWSKLYDQSVLGITYAGSQVSTLLATREVYALSLGPNSVDTVCILQPNAEASYQKAIPAKGGGFWLGGSAQGQPVLFYVLASKNTWGTLKANEIEADFNSQGLLFSRYARGNHNGVRNFLWKDTSQFGLIYNAGLWLQGKVNGQDCISATNGTEFNGYDFMSGPVAQTYNADYLRKYDRVWTVNKAEINHHRNHYATPGYKVPQSIKNWPGNGDSALGAAPLLAPFVDMNANELYEPNLGDYPQIKGDQAVYFIYNDLRGNHLHTGGKALGVEVHAMAYALDTNHSVLENSIFINFKIVNRSGQTIHSLKPGIYTDYEIGQFIDDIAGCNSKKGFTYGLNGNAYDSWLGPNSPAIALCALSDSLDGHISYGHYIGRGSVNQNIIQPETATEYQNYMNLKWKDGNNLVLENPNGFRSLSNGNGYNTSGNYPVTKYHFDLEDDWYNYGQGVVGQPMSLSIFQTTSLADGAFHCLDVAYTVTPSQGLLTQVTMLNSLGTAADSLRAFYNRDTSGCLEYKINLPESDEAYKTSFGIYPNPAQAELNLRIPAGVKVEAIEIYALSGKQVMRTAGAKQLAIGHLPSGLYLIQLHTNAGQLNERFIVR